MSDNGQAWDWRRLIPSTEWHTLALDNFPGWNKHGGSPRHFYLKHVHGKTSSSREIATEWDDISGGNFWYRDMTKSGLPFVDGDEVYHSCFCFQFEEDWTKFGQHFGSRIEVVDELPMT